MLSPKGDWWERGRKVGTPQCPRTNKMKSHIVENMLKKAEEAENNGDKKRSEHWLKRAGEVEEYLKKLQG